LQFYKRERIFPNCFYIVTMQIVTIGGGASGFMGAITAAETFPNARVIILEKHKTVLNKVRVSGGGRCNVTHQPLDLRFFIKNYPRGDKFLRKLLGHFDARETIAWFEARGIQLKTESDGRVFPVTDSSQTIIECLIRTARALNIEIVTHTNVRSFSVIEDNPGPGFWILLDDGQRIPADRLLITTGGYPKLSATTSSILFPRCSPSTRREVICYHWRVSLSPMSN
jgi:predicted Rossmann fold flavoprotein